MAEKYEVLLSPSGRAAGGRLAGPPGKVSGRALWDGRQVSGRRVEDVTSHQKRPDHGRRAVSPPKPTGPAGVGASKGRAAAATQEPKGGMASEAAEDLPPVVKFRIGKDGLPRTSNGLGLQKQQMPGSLCRAVRVLDAEGVLELERELDAGKLGMEGPKTRRMIW